MTEEKKKANLTICIMSKLETCSETMACLLTSVSSPSLCEKLLISFIPCIGHSDITRGRSIRMSRWYKEAKEGDYFMFIDADQTFTPEDILKCYEYAQKYELVCGMYSKRDGNMASQPKDMVRFCRNKEGELWYGATGFMMTSYNTVKKVAEYLKEEVYVTSSDTDYQFFYERIVSEPGINRNEKNLWISEDFSFCWLVRQVGGTVYGFLSETIGHIVTETKYLKYHINEKPWPSNSIVYYCGDTKEKWCPDDINSGLGGSESAVIKLSREWVKHGYEVTVFCACSKPGQYDGVTYKNSGEFNLLDEFNILIIWRNPGLFTICKPLAKKVYLDIHDHKKDIINSYIISRIDKIMAKSKFQIEEFSKEEIPKEKYAIIPNGGAYPKNKDLVVGQTIKDPNYIIYTSFYNRGLAFILKWAWPKIKKACPDAYLKIFYGWDNLIKNNEETEDFKLFRDTIEDLMKQDGVIHCGRVSHEEIRKEKEKANIHLYTGMWPEVDCISIRESASAGAIPIVSADMKVFKEKPYCITISGNPISKAMQEKAADRVITLLKNPILADRAREEVLKYDFETWESVAEMWIKDFEE